MCQINAKDLFFSKYEFVQNKEKLGGKFQRFKNKFKSKKRRD